MVKFVFITLFFGIFHNGLIIAQSNQPEQIEKELSELLIDLRKAKSDKERKAINTDFKTKIEQVIEEDWSYDYSFESLKSIGKIYSQDKNVRIISWNVQWEDDSHSYFAYVLKKHARRDKHHVTELIDNSAMMPPQPTETLDSDNWYGALYYDIVDVKKGRKTYYTLFGYDAKNNLSTIKLLDVLYFTGKRPNFGYPLFETQEGLAKRIYFEHAAKTVMSLKYDQQRKMIIFDHLSPEAPGLAEFREFYVPDMSYDGYKYEDNKWVLKEDVIAYNKEKEKDYITINKYDEELDTIVKVSVKGKWINPTDKNAPIDGGSHKAALPEEDNKNKSRFNLGIDKIKSRKKEKEFSGVRYSNYPTDTDKKEKKRQRKSKSKND